MRTAILTGEYGPNTRLVEAEIAEELEASRTPVREVLQRLHNEGLVISRRRGWVVRAYTADDIREIYQVRLALEGYAARLASTHPSADERAQLLPLANAFFDAFLKGDFDASARANDTFHETLNRLAGNPRLEHSIMLAREHYFTHRLAKLFPSHDFPRSHREHLHIAQSVFDGDGADAEAAVRDHLAETMRIALQYEVF